MRYFLAALALVLAPMGMAVLQPAAAQTDESERAFAQWMLQVTNVVERASAVNNELSALQQSYNPNGNREAQLAAMRAVRTHAMQSRPQLVGFGEELIAIGPFEHPAAPADLIEFSRAMVTDTQTYLRNMDEILGAMIEAVNAFERNDRAAFDAVAPRLVRGAALLLEGQIVMFRARQRAVPQDESAYHSLGAMVSLYEGMSALIMPSVDNRQARVNAAAQSAETWGVSGRAALARQSAGLVGFPPNQQAIIDEMFNLEGQFYAANDRVVALLRAAAQEAAAGASSQQLNTRYTGQIAAIEVEYQRINARQVELYSQLTQMTQ
jgi:hypothetical protein